MVVFIWSLSKRDRVGLVIVVARRNQLPLPIMNPVPDVSEPRQAATASLWASSDAFGRFGNGSLWNK